MLSVLMLKAIMLSVIILDAVNSKVVAPSEKRRLKKMEDARFFRYKGETKYCTAAQACRLPQQVSLF